MHRPGSAMVGRGRAMPLPQIAVEIVVPDAPPRGSARRKNPVESPELRRALLQACSDTVQVAVCVNADSARGAAALALVFWKGSTHARIEVGSKESPGGQTWSSREIDFAPRDALVERWRAAGYAAGTLASLLIKRHAKGPPAEAPSIEEKGAASPAGSDTAAPSSPAASATTPAASESKPATPKPVTKPAAPVSAPAAPPRPNADEGRNVREPGRRGFWTWAFDAAATVGPGFSSNAPRIGGFVRATRAFGGPFVTASVGYSAERAGTAPFTSRWLSPALGAGLGTEVGGGFSLEARTEVVADWLEVHADDPSTGESSSSSRWVVGGRAGASVAWAPLDALAVFVGGAIEARGPATDVVVRGVVTTTTSLVTYGAEGGIRVMSW